MSKELSELIRPLVRQELKRRAELCVDDGEVKRSRVFQVGAFHSDDSVDALFDDQGLFQGGG